MVGYRSVPAFSMPTPGGAGLRRGADGPQHYADRFQSRDVDETFAGVEPLRGAVGFDRQADGGEALTPSFADECAD
ncbi:hypothetical protein DF220_04725 [Salinibacterium hongtaonis]|uniref:Uncharacterized protein n=1 Tax=Homoserinimonas hongtaonis TaxID=2079791 RepID=A0A2U1T0B3_9MICO|nr:hypothetical protein DF220_04725 [Salinibacterium hongtaonis]